MRRVQAAAATMALTVGLAGGCASSGGDEAATTTAPTTVTTSTAPTSASTTTTTVSSTTTTTTAPPGPSTFSPDPKAAAAQLVAAWKAGDKLEAAKVADAVSVANIFTQAADGFELYGCDSGQFDTSTCNYRNRATGGYAQITSSRQPQGWVVSAVYMSTDG